MKRIGGLLLYVWLSAPLLAQNAANSAPPVDEKIDSPLEYFFGVLALIALVMTWTWLWLKTRDYLKPRVLVQPPEPAEPDAEEQLEDDAEETEKP